MSLEHENGGTNLKRVR